MARSSMGNLLFGEKYKYLLGIAFFWEKIQISSVRDLLFEKKTQISFSYSYFFWKTTNSMRVTATFSGKTTNIFQLRLLFLEKQRIPRVRRLQIDSYEKKGSGKSALRLLSTPSIQSCVYMIDEAFMLLYFGFVSSEVR